jgi:D-alanyl-D-alanine carboxypeptidase
MKVGIIKAPVVLVLLFIAKLISLVESRLFDVLLKTLSVLVVVCVLAVHRTNIEYSFRRIGNSIRTLVWYKTLPKDYFKKLDQNSQVIYAKYLEAIKPQPPKKTADITFPVVSAKSYYILDVASNTVLGSKDSGLALPPASTAKLATALAAFKIYKLDEIIAVPEFCTQLDSTKAEFLPGQRFLVSDLLKALLVYSSGDAGCVLSIGKTSYAEFVGLMNDVVKEAGLQNTKFTNPVGLDDSDGQNLSSAKDLAELGVVAIKNNFIKEVVKLKDFELKDLGGKYSKKLTNTNRLLFDIPETVGIKTGTTTGAGEVLIYEYVKDKTDLVIVVMGSKDRFTDMKAILGWVSKNYSWN